MNVFISHSSREKDVASRIAYGLEEAGDHVFLDRSSLVPGEAYDLRIREAIEHSDVFVFLASPEAVSPGCYALAELTMAERAADTSALKILPVMASNTDYAAMPPYLRTLTVLVPAGDIVAEATAAVAEVRAEFNRRKVAITTTVDNSQWTIAFQIMDENCREIFYRFSDEPEFKSTGFFPMLNPRSGLPMPRFFVTVPPMTGKHGLLVKFTDYRGRERGPYPLVFDATEQVVAAARELMEMAGPLVRFGGKDENIFAIFTALSMASKGAIREIQFSVDDDSLSKRLLPSTESFGELVQIPASTRYIYMKVIFINGTERPAERFMRTNAT
jgi:hypothetical protein